MFNKVNLKEIFYISNAQNTVPNTVTKPGIGELLAAGASNLTDINGNNFDSNAYFSGYTQDDKKDPTVKNSENKSNVTAVKETSSTTAVQSAPKTEAVQEAPIASPKIANSHFTQGKQVGNCVGVAALQSFARTKEGLEYLNSIVKKDKNDDFVVSFPNRDPITIKESVVRFYSAVEDNDYIEAITFALYKATGKYEEVMEALSKNRGKGKAPIGLDSAKVFECLTGCKPNAIYRSSEGGVDYDDLLLIDRAQKSGRKLLMQTGFVDVVKKATNKNGDKKQAFPGHAFTILSVDVVNNVVKFANPWYYDDNKIISMPIKTFQKYCNNIALVEMKSDDGKISFSNPDIGSRGDSESLVKSFNLTKEDYQNYLETHNYENLYITDFRGTFDNTNYSLLTDEGHTPLSLVKQYAESKTVPEFKNKKLQEQREKIKKWIEENYESITHNIQRNLYNDQADAIRTMQLEKANKEIEAEKIAAKRKH